METKLGKVLDDFAGASKSRSNDDLGITSMLVTMWVLHRVRKI